MAHKNYFNENTIVAFHIGRGGKFYNGGHLTFLGEGTIRNYTEDCCAPSTVINEELVDDDAPEAEWTDCNGNSVGLTNAEYESGIGCIDMDGEYDTTYTKRLGDVVRDSKEWDAIMDSDHCDAEDAQDWLNDWRRVSSMKHYKSNTDIIFCDGGSAMWTWDGWDEADEEEIKEGLAEFLDNLSVAPGTIEDLVDDIVSHNPFN